MNCVYLSPLCLCIASATSHCSACSNITSVWYGEACGVFICFNIPAGVSHFRVHEQLYTSPKLTLQRCSCNASYCILLVAFFTFNFLFLFSIYHFFFPFFLYLPLSLSVIIGLANFISIPNHEARWCTKN